jgi:hypothetical protein
MTDKLAALQAKLRNNETITYEDGADIFENTIVGNATMQQNGLTRAGVIALLRSRFPSEEVLSESLRAMQDAFDRATKGAH